LAEEVATVRPKPATTAADPSITDEAIVAGGNDESILSGTGSVSVMIPTSLPFPSLPYPGCAISEATADFHLGAPLLFES
jgi:hypothetical protein